MQLQLRESLSAAIGRGTHFPYSGVSRAFKEVGGRTYVRLYRYTPVQIGEPLHKGDDEKGTPKDVGNAAVFACDTVGAVGIRLGT